MTSPIRVVVWARSASRAREIAARLDGPPVEVVAIVSDAERPQLAASADLLVVADEDARGALEASSSAVRDPTTPLLVITDAADAADRIARHKSRAWGVVGQGFSAGQLRAAVLAVASGLVVTTPAPQGDAVAEPEEADRDEWPGVGTLTPREIDVLEALALGLSNRAVASRLGLSENTVKFHVASIYGKLGASTRTQAVRRGLRRGLIRI